MEKDLISMSPRDRDVLKVMSGVLKGDRAQVEAARLLNRSVRQIRRVAGRRRSEEDGVVMRRLPGSHSCGVLSFRLRRLRLQQDGLSSSARPSKR